MSTSKTTTTTTTVTTTTGVNTTTITTTITTVTTVTTVVTTNNKNNELEYLIESSNKLLADMVRSDRMTDEFSMRCKMIDSEIQNDCFTYLYGSICGEIESYIEAAAEVEDDVDFSELECDEDDGDDDEEEDDEVEEVRERCDNARRVYKAMPEEEKVWYAKDIDKEISEIKRIRGYDIESYHRKLVDAMGREDKEDIAYWGRMIDAKNKIMNEDINYVWKRRELFGDKKQITVIMKGGVFLRVK